MNKPERGGTPVSTPMWIRAFLTSLFLIFPLSSVSKSVKRVSASIAKSSSSSKKTRRLFPSKIDTTTGSSGKTKIY